mmetsp:Transcript_31130/g.72476  ORF Transcript_31130/g.72476 Transcript_31130/m.72476 type:complete len:692 (-) Transcript_31130:232-2307(-)
MIRHMERANAHQLDLIRRVLDAHTDRVHELLMHNGGAVHHNGAAFAAAREQQHQPAVAYVRSPASRDDAGGGDSAALGATSESSQPVHAATRQVSFKVPTIQEEGEEEETGPGAARGAALVQAQGTGSEGAASATASAAASGEHSTSWLPTLPSLTHLVSSEGSGGGQTTDTKHFAKEEAQRLEAEARDAIVSIARNEQGHGEHSHSLSRHELTGNSIEACLERIVHSRWFEMMICINIVANVFTISAKADARMKAPGVNDAVPTAWVVVDLACTAIFVIELSLRLWVEGRKTFFDREKASFKWNVMDLILVFFAIIEGIVDLVSDSVSFVDISALRLFGLGRLVRVIPSTQFLRSFSDLRVMILSILYGLASMFWSALVLSFVVLLIAICVMEMLLSTATKNAFEWNSDIEEYWGDLWISIYTVYKCITGGIDWGDAAAPLFDRSGFTGVVFCGFIAFSQLLLLNVMTGVFVKNAADASQRDENIMMLYELDQRRRWVRQVIRIFETANKSHEGVLTKAEFCKAMGELRIQLLLSRLGIDIKAHSPESLFMLFDHDGNGSIEISEFAASLHHFHGYARSVDVATIKFSLHTLHKHVQALERFIIYGTMPSAKLLSTAPALDGVSDSEPLGGEKAEEDAGDGSAGGKRRHHHYQILPSGRGGSKNKPPPTAAAEPDEKSEAKGSGGLLLDV